MTQSESIKELATALSKAQSEMKGAEKDSTNPFFKNHYASLDSVWDAIRGPLTKNGLAVIQTTETHSYEDDGIMMPVDSSKDSTTTKITIKNVRMLLITTLMHSSGEWVRGTYLLNPSKNDPQGMGAALSYARRYALAAIVGLTQADDDAERAIQRPQSNYVAPKPIPKAPVQSTRGSF